MSKLNTNSNAYIIIYSAILVVVVAFLLAFVSSALKSRQEANVELDVKKQILNSLNLRGLDDAAAEAKYAEVVKAEIDLEGQKAYACLVNDEEIMVFSLKGMGLWGGISGFIAIHGEDTPTVYGAYFNHESETAGLGAEIKDSQAWQEKFIGKKVFANGDVALSVVKKVEDPETQVDCVTGATLTSNGVNDMLKVGLKAAAITYFKSSSTSDSCCDGHASDCCEGEKAASDCCEGEKTASDCCEGEKAAPDCCEGEKAAPDCCEGEKTAASCCDDKPLAE